MHGDDNALVRLIERIMKLPYFDGMNQTMEYRRTRAHEMVQYLIEYNCYDYLLLISKYFSKNNLVIEKAINTVNSQGEHPLFVLLRTEHASEKWLLFYFSLCKQCKITIGQDTLKKVLESMDDTFQKYDQRWYSEDEKEKAKFLEERDLLLKKCKSILKQYLVHDKS